MGFSSRRILCFPKLEGELGPRMQFHGKNILNWSLNDYLGLANHPEVRQADTDGNCLWCCLSNGSSYDEWSYKFHEQLENELAEFVMKESAYLLNFGYQGMVSIIDALVTKNDILFMMLILMLVSLMEFVCTWVNVLPTAQ
jgi:glycine C-acetyltransferase